MTRDLAVVLSGGFVTEGLRQVGFLKAIKESALWPRRRVFIGTSVGAINGSFAALDRLEELEQIWLDIQPSDLFETRSFFELPFSNSFNISKFETYIRDRFGDPVELAHQLVNSDVEFVTITTDLAASGADPVAQKNINSGENILRRFECAYSSKHNSPQKMVEAIFASAAIPLYREPRRVEENLQVDGGWLRDFPLTYAFDYPEVQKIIAFWRPGSVKPFSQDPFLKAIQLLVKPLWIARWIPLFGKFIRAMEKAVEHGSKGEPIAIWSIIERLVRIQVLDRDQREIIVAGEKTQDLKNYYYTTSKLLALALKYIQNPEDRAALTKDFAQEASQCGLGFSFFHDKPIEPIYVIPSATAFDLNPPIYRLPLPRTAWRTETKRALEQSGYEVSYLIWPFIKVSWSKVAKLKLIQSGYDETRRVLEEKGLWK